MKIKNKKRHSQKCLKDFYFFIFSILVSQCLSVFVMCSVSFAERHSRICFQKYCFSVEIAQTEEQRMKGLMFRENLPQDAGMFFIFDEPGTPGFWMKNTRVSLDMIWLDKDMRVVHIEENVLPCKEDPCRVYSSEFPSRYVLELNAGKARAIGLKLRDRFEISDQ